MVTAPTQTMVPARLAVFDYDGTILSGQSGSLFSRYLLSNGLVTKRTALRLFWWGVRYKLHLPFRQDEARELIFRDLGAHGYDYAEILRRADEGCTTVLVSATFFEIARLAAERLGIDGVAATRMERDANGAYTGKVDGEVVAGEGKVRAVVAWAEERFGHDWSIVYAYGDHFTDEPLLERADTPYAVCPGTTLSRIAKKRGWQSLNWR